MVVAQSIWNSTMNHAAAITDIPPDHFDFIIGDWRVRHRRLKTRLAGCGEWIEFEGTSTTRKILGGFGNLEDNTLDLPDGPYRAVALRSFDPATATWSIWWLDWRHPDRIDTPVVGRFTDSMGLFYADDSLDGTPIRVRFTWTSLATHTARWEQAFSVDGGDTWETNWTMDFFRVGS
jgi:hypothetical protein